MAQPLVWPGSGSSPTGKTPFGYYDGDSAFVQDAPRFAVWAARRLGYPIIDIELIDESFYACYEESVSEYSNQVLSFQIRENMLALTGRPANSATNTYNLTTTVLPMTLQRTIEIARNYGQEGGVDGNITWRKGYVTLRPNVQTYDLKTLWGDVSESSKRMEIKRIFHNEPVAFGYGMANMFNSVGVLGSAGAGGAIGTLAEFGWEGMVPSLATGISYTVMPVYEDLLRMQAVELNNTIRRSGYGFDLRNNVLTIFPIPGQTFKLWFDYIIDEDRILGATPPVSGTLAYSASLVSSGSVVTNIGNAPYNNIQYNTLNDPAKQWIRKYALACAKFTLGDVREKYSTIPIPGAEITLNGPALKMEAQAEKESLITQLREDLERTTPTTQLDIQRQQAENIEQVLKRTPMYTAIMVG
jgi:hypothetical protein